MAGEPNGPADTGQPPRSEPRAHAAHWIEDDDLLRDEAVTLGLSDLEELPATKIESIHTYYRAQTFRNEERRQAVLEMRDRLEDQAAHLRERISGLDLRVPGADQSPPRARPDQAHTAAAHSPGLLRDVAGTLLALAVCGLAYFIVRDLLGGTFAHPALVSLGVTLAGMFVVFAPVSLIYSTDEARANGPWATDMWKIRLIEFGMPALAAFFIVTWGQAQGALRDVAAFLFLAMLFLVGGRLLLSLLARTGSEINQTRFERRQRKREGAMHEELAALHERIHDVEREITAVPERLRSIPTADELDAIRDHKLALFRSEFELARTARDGRAPKETETVVLPTYSGEARVS